MANLKELTKKIKDLHTLNNPSDLNEKIDLCFEALKLYSNIASKKHTQHDEKDCCYAAAILSGLIQKGLSKKVMDFLATNKVPLRVEQVLRANFMRMEGY